MRKPARYLKLSSAQLMSPWQIPLGRLLLLCPEWLVMIRDSLSPEYIILTEEKSPWSLDERRVFVEHGGLKLLLHAKFQNTIQVYVVWGIQTPNFYTEMEIRMTTQFHRHALQQRHANADLSFCLFSKVDFLFCFFKSSLHVRWLVLWRVWQTYSP